MIPGIVAGAGSAAAPDPPDIQADFDFSDHVSFTPPAIATAADFDLSDHVSFTP